MNFIKLMKAKTALCLFSVINLMPVYGQIQTYNMPSELKSSQLEPLKPRENNPPAKTAPVPPVSLPAAPTAQSAAYFFPGLVVFRQGMWQGGDNLLNLSSDIGLYIMISKPENDSLSVDEIQLKMVAESIFQKAGIRPTILVAPGQAPLPFFQFQILIYPIKEGYVASCEGRLFESVTLKRIELDSTDMAFQAVTWQKSTLIVSPTNKFQAQLQLNVEDIANSFITVYQAFQKK